eukprot:gb/GECH01013221.1/.p1 GENE.gb/GECH01013221.1/~~gb/GECH01013221.1/.p1  ORF type:complete len:750 (+),score=201.49 gb/GECH01013221.1/:1-2250(+)
MSSKKNNLSMPSWMRTQHEQKEKPADKKNQKWTVLKEAIGQIYEEQAAKLSFQVLYENAFHLVLYKQGDLLYNGVQETIRNYIHSMRQKILECDDSTFLGVLLDNWFKHRKAVLLIRDILLYMEKTYVEPVNKTGKTSVYNYGVNTFGNEVINHQRITSRIQRLVLSLIQQEREGGISVDRFLLKNLASMLTDIGKENYYEPVLEKKLLEESRIFFQKEAAGYFDNTTAPEYLQKVKTRLLSETERAKRCLDSATLPKLEHVLKEEMIQRYVEEIIHKEQSGVQAMLEDWRQDDLRLVYEVLGLQTSALNPVIDRLREFCKKEGFAIVNEESYQEKPNAMVEELIDLRQKYDQLLYNSFSYKQGGVNIRDKDFSIAIKRGFEDIVNSNQRLPEFLSLYVDSKLKKGKNQIPETEYDSLFDRVISIFRHMREKDIFERYYKHHLASRLLGGRSASDEAEKSFITKLKSEFGYQFTAKLEGMFTDMRLCKDYNSRFQEFLASNPDYQPNFDMTINVLTTGSWPVTNAPPCSPPQEITKATEAFNTFYYKTHSGRKLTWQYNMGTADIRANGFDKQYEFSVHTYQMIILMFFNENKELPYSELLNLSRIPPDDLKRNILALSSKGKHRNGLLKKTGDPSQLDSDTVFSVNQNFRSKFIRVKVSPIKLIDENPEETIEKINEDRKWKLDASIVRCMKARKTMEHRDLVIEVTKMLEKHFMPKPEDIKKRIESLIEREYMQRSEESRSRYHYMA